MVRSIAAICAVPLLAGVAAAGDPGEALERAFEAREASMAQDLENQTQRALRHHRVMAEAAAKVADCRAAIASAEARAQSASERQHRLIECFDRQRADDALIAVNPE